MPLGEVVDTQSGLWTGKKGSLKNVGVIRNTNFTKDCTLDLSNLAYIDVEVKQLEKRTLYNGDIIIEKSGGSDTQPVGRVVLYEGDQELSYSNFTSRLRTKVGMDIIPKYLHKYLQKIYLDGETQRLQSQTTGIHNLDLKAYLKLPIPVPPREEQERIVRRLDLANEVVEKQKAELSELDALASALFYASFGDPVSNPHHLKGENKSFEECLNKSPKIKRKLKQSDYKEEGKYPVISQEQEFISGYTDNEEDVIRVEHPMVIFGDHTRHVKYVDFDFAVGADGVKLLDTKPFINPKFFYYLLKCINIPSAGYSRHYKFLKELTVFIPPLAEQEAFAKKVEAIEVEKARVRASLADSEALLASLLRSSFP